MFGFRASRAALPIFARQFSAEAAHAPPKKLYGVTGKYAEALYVAASKAKSLEKVETELQAFTATLAKQPAFAGFLANPTVSRAEKIDLVESTLEDGKVSHITKNFLSTLAGNGRISECSEVVSNYEELLRTARGSISITVTSADSLSKAQVDSVSSAVKAMVGKKFTCDINYAVDAKIMGGLQVMVGEKFLDLSISQRMSELSKELEGL